MPYRRDRTTWVAFGCLFGFGVLNAALGPALPYLRAEEGIGYLTASIHQVGYAVGGGCAGLLTAATSRRLSRRRGIAVGLLVAAVASLGIAYGGTPVLTVAAAFVVSLAGTSALIRVWALLADLHREHRTVAMSEGEVWVSLAGILTPLLIGAVAGTALTWRGMFLVGAVLVAATALTAALTPLPVEARPAAPAARGWRQATLLVVVAVVALEFSLTFWLASYLDDEVGLGRDLAATMVSLLYAAALLGRLLVSALARRWGAAPLLVAALLLSVAGTPLLLLAPGALVAGLGIVVVGVGMGATFPLTSSLHVQASPLRADEAVGQVLAVAAVGQVVGPLTAGVVAQVADLRTGLLVVPVLCLVALAGTRAVVR
ncbi:MFS transporter [Nocardioides anomalus]|uniref:MFS transporter n=1 Tax=Nocardioides anomalus TaxID=2712223 RepID=A0A6G6WIK9_9ACTN|nr:MFS transporter [Nocardioides anomalus]QIG44983.1 MFS transporter [Nocardioides anomalus]